MAELHAIGPAAGCRSRARTEKIFMWSCLFLVDEVVEESSVMTLTFHDFLEAVARMANMLDRKGKVIPAAAEAGEQMDHQFVEAEKLAYLVAGKLEHLLQELI